MSVIERVRSLIPQRREAVQTQLVPVTTIEQAFLKVLYYQAVSFPGLYIETNKLLRRVGREIDLGDIKKLGSHLERCGYISEDEKRSIGDWKQWRLTGRGEETVRQLGRLRQPLSETALVQLPIEDERLTG